TLTGTTAAVAVKVYGADLDDIDQAAGDVARALAKVPHADNVRVEPQTGTPELVIRVRPRDAARIGLRNAAILDAVHAAYQGAEIGQVYDRNRVIDLVVVLDARRRDHPDRVGDLWLNVDRAAGSAAGGAALEGSGALSTAAAAPHAGG